MFLNFYKHFIIKILGKIPKKVHENFMHPTKNYQLQRLWNSLLASSYLTPCLFLICFAEIFKKKPQTPSCLPASPTFHSEWIFKGGKRHCLRGIMSLPHLNHETYGLIPSLQKAILKQSQRQARWHSPLGVFVEPSNSIIQLQFSLIKWYWWTRAERRHNVLEPKKVLITRFLVALFPPDVLGSVYCW